MAGACFVVDDRSAADILHDGDIDAVVRKAIRLGLDPVRAVQMATINAAVYFRLEGLGAIAPGYFANLIVLDDLADFRVESVYYRGRLVAREGRPLFPLPRPPAGRPDDTVNMAPLTARLSEASCVGRKLPGHRGHTRPDRH